MIRRDESGSITPFVVILSLGILALAALVVDGGRQLNAKGRAIAYAQEAARAGSQAVDLTDPQLDLVPSRARQIATEYCQQAITSDSSLKSCDVTVPSLGSGDGQYYVVQVVAHVQVEPILLGMVRPGPLNASGTAVARPVTGISNPDTGKQLTLAPPSVAPPGGEIPTEVPEPSITEIPPCTPSSAIPTPTPEPPGQPTGQPTGQPPVPPGPGETAAPTLPPTALPDAPLPTFTGPPVCPPVLPD